MELESGPTPTALTFDRACLAELVVLCAAFFWGIAFHTAVLEDFRLELGAGLLGGLAVMPPFLLFWWTLNTEVAWLAGHRTLVEKMLRPLFSRWSILQLLLISLFAGIAEEALFRGGLQRTLAQHIGSGPALLLASLIFGCAHPLSLLYMILATAVGAYLGWLWIYTGNLLTPIVVHVIYDFLALVYLLRIYPGAK